MGDNRLSFRLGALPCLRCVWAVLVLSLGLADAHAKHTYRYRTAAGEVVTTDALPPGQAKLGYEVVDIATNRVLRRVEPEQSKDDIQREQERKRKLRACERELRKLRARYTSVADISAARDRDLESRDGQLGMLRHGLAQARSELDRYQQLAVADERAGRSISRPTRRGLKRLGSQVEELEAQIQRRIEERRIAIEGYRREAEIFRAGTCSGTTEAR